MVTVASERRNRFLGPGLSTFVGREREVEALLDLLGSARLVTLTGPGGSGKTRLALEAAERLARAGERVELVEFAALRDPALVAATIAGGLGLRAAGREPPLELVIRVLSPGESLLVLDNLEQLLPAGATSVAELLARCPGLRIVVTSRVPLNLAAEHLLRVGPLAVPTAGEDGALAHVPSVVLLVERARAAGADLDLEGPEGPAIGAICRRLDGLPLALELAAARLRLLSPTALLARLSEGLGVLGGGPLDGPDRQRTMRATIAWSVDLLPAREAALFPRLGVFRGGFTLEGARDISAPGIVSDDDELWEALGVLVDHSLLHVTSDRESELRFGLLATIHEYAVEQLSDVDLLRERHLCYHIAFAEEAAAGLQGPRRRSMARRLRDEAENLRAALAHAATLCRGPEMLRLTAALGPYWIAHGDLREGRDWLERAIALASPGPSAPLAGTLIGLARITFILGDRRRGQVLAAQAIDVASAVDDQGAVGRALWLLATDATYDSRSDAASTLLEQSLAVARECDDAALASSCLVTMGNVAWYQGDRYGARRLYEESMAMATKIADPLALSFMLLNLGSLLVLAFGDPRGGLTHLESALGMLRDADVHHDLGWACLAVGQARLRLGHIEPAREAVREGLRLGSQTASPDELIEALGVMADWLGTVGASQSALRAWGANQRAREELGSSLSPGERAWMEPLWARDRRAAGEPLASLAWAQGAAMVPETALATALAAMDAVDLTARHPTPTLAPRGAALTPREVEVLALVGEGLSDGQIAERLFISKKTASVHVANLKGKLGTDNRVETALEAVRLGLVGSPGC